MSKVTEEPPIEVCCHRWLIEAPHGTPLLHGVCRLCNASRLFPSSPDLFFETKSGRLWNNPPVQRVTHDPTFHTDGVLW